MTKIVAGAAGLLLASAIVAACAGTALAGDAARVAKDTGPASARCDAYAKGTAAWMACVGQPALAMADEELFYAGYWLAKSGRYAEALGYLTLARTQDERVLTYIGFATRKLGRVDEAMPLYRKALATNPDYVVARAYLGEAFLTRGEPEMARAELAEIARRCGVTCAAYVDLDGHIRDYEAQSRKG